LAAATWSATPTPANGSDARLLWDEVEDDVKKYVRNLQIELTASLTERLKIAGKMVLDSEKKRFDRRKRELEVAIGDNQLNKIAKERDKLLADARQMSLFSEIDQERQKRLADLNAELALRKHHYERVQERLAEEAERTLKRVLPLRYKLRGQARVYPIAVEIRTPGGAK